MPSFIKLESGRLLNLDLVTSVEHTCDENIKAFVGNLPLGTVSDADFATIRRLYCVPPVVNRCEPGLLAKLKALNADVAVLANKADERSRKGTAHMSHRDADAGRFDAYCAVQTMLSVLIKEIEQ